MIEARQALQRLRKEIVFFEQLAQQFPTISQSLTKHARDCKRVAAALQRRLDDGREEDARKALNVAEVFLKEGQRQRLKLRIGLMKQLITALELEAHLWPAMTDTFKAHATRCRNALSYSRQQLHPGASDEIKVRLRELSDLHKQGELLRQQQKQARLEGAGQQLSRLLDQIHAKHEQFTRQAANRPELASRYRRLADFSQTEYDKIKPRLFSRQSKELEQTLGYAKHVVARILEAEERADQAYQQSHTAQAAANKRKAEEELASRRVEKERAVSVKKDAQFGPVQRTLRMVLSPMRRDGFSGAADYMQHTLAHLVTGLGKLMLVTVGTLVLIAFVVMMIYLTGSGFSGVGLL